LIHANDLLELDYVNHRGERAVRRIRVIEWWFGTSEWHDGPQWFCRAMDCDKGQQRDFALEGFKGWKALT
jgi:hypothetical protein